MECVDCNLCGSKRTETVLTQRDLSVSTSVREFTVVKCSDCGLIYLNPRPTPAEISSFYPSEYYGVQHEKKKTTLEMAWKSFSKKIKRWIMEDYYGYPRRSPPSLRTHFRKWLLLPEVVHLKINQKSILPFLGEGKLLDVGCGPGVNLSRFKDYGWETYGVEFSPLAAEQARKKTGSRVFEGDLLSAGFKDRYFDVVFFSHSLEHMYDPKNMLQETRRILKDNGRLIVCVPNAGCWEAKIFSRWWIPWDLPRHLYHFDRVTLNDLLERTGFKATRIYTGIGSNTLMRSLEYLFKNKWGKKFFAKKTLNRCVAKPLAFLAGHLGHGSEITVWADK
jgi:SAM-dependent methyltransferase